MQQPAPGRHPLPGRIEYPMPIPSIGHDFLLWYAPGLRSAPEARRWIQAPPPASPHALAALQALLAAVIAHFPLEGPTWIDDPALNLDLGTLGLLVEHPAAPALRSFLYDNAPALGLVCCDLTADVLHCCDGTMVERALGD